MAKYVLLSIWAKKHGIPLQNAKDSARRGSLRSYSKTTTVPIPRLVIRVDTPPEMVKIGSRAPIKKTKKKKVTS